MWKQAAVMPPKAWLTPVMIGTNAVDAVAKLYLLAVQQVAACAGRIGPAIDRLDVIRSAVSQACAGWKTLGIRCIA